MKWFHLVLVGGVLIAAGIWMRKKEVDGAAHARSFRGKSEPVKDESDGSNGNQ